MSRKTLQSGMKLIQFLAIAMVISLMLDCYESLESKSELEVAGTQTLSQVESSPQSPIQETPQFTEEAVPQQKPTVETVNSTLKVESVKKVVPVRKVSPKSMTPSKPRLSQPEMLPLWCDQTPTTDPAPILVGYDKPIDLPYPEMPCRKPEIPVVITGDVPDGSDVQPEAEIATTPLPALEVNAGDTVKEIELPSLSNRDYEDLVFSEF